MRIFRAIAVIALLTAAVLGALYGARVALGFLAGAAFGLLNLWWTKRAVEGIAERSIGSKTIVGAGGLVAGFLLRYGLMALAGYVIFKSSAASFYGFLAGLFVPVAAMMAEAAYELYLALRREQ